MTVIDATDCLLGRMSSLVAKRLLLGEKIDIVNAEKAVVTGTKDEVTKHYLARSEIGSRDKGPFWPKSPERIVKRTIRGMLPHKKTRGLEAFKRLKTYIGVPEAFAKEKAEVLQDAHISKSFSHKFVPVADISRALGGKWNE